VVSDSARVDTAGFCRRPRDPPTFPNCVKEQGSGGQALPPARVKPLQRQEERPGGRFTDLRRLPHDLGKRSFLVGLGHALGMIKLLEAAREPIRPLRPEAKSVPRHPATLGRLTLAQPSASVHRHTLAAAGIVLTWLPGLIQAPSARPTRHSRKAEADRVRDGRRS
jgi:hypothetical protein